MQDRPPNVLVIVTDQQRYDSLGCTGNSAIQTPHLDKLAASGGMFDRHFTAHPVCMPSRASLMTGCYPSVHGVWDNGIPLARNQWVPTNERTQKVLEDYWSDPAQHPPVPSHLPTLADAFSATGYRSSAFGKLHLTPTMSDRRVGQYECEERWDSDPAMADWHGPYYGFEYVELSLGHGPLTGGHYNHWLQHQHPKVWQLIREEINHAHRPTHLNDLYSTSHTRETHPTNWVADRVCEKIKQHASADEPFLIWAGIPDPHHPFTPPRDLAEQFEKHDVMPCAAAPSTMTSPPRWVEYARGGHASIDEATIRLVRQYTDAMVTMIDMAVGRMLDTLQANNLADNTIVVFTSDHGDYLGNYGLLRKTIYPSRVLNQTPLIINDPKQRLAGRHAVPASNTDLFPTLAALAGVTLPQGIQGEDLATVLTKGRSLPVMTQSGNGLVDATSLTLIDEYHRTTWWPGTENVDCFDHRNDPMELNNLAATGDDSSIKPRLARLQEAYGRAVRPTFGRVTCW